MIVWCPAISMLWWAHSTGERVDVVLLALGRAVAEPDCYGPFRLVGASLVSHLNCVDLEDLREVEILRQRGRQVLHDTVSCPFSLGTLCVDVQPAHGGTAVDAGVAGRVTACAVTFHAGMPADLSALVFHLWVLLFRFTTVGVRYCVLDAGFQVRMWTVPLNGTVRKFVVWDGSSQQMPR